jgi:hypothetical protein
MSLDATNQVDAVGTEQETDIVVLTIMDSWNWDDEKGHLQALQDKLNAYFSFVESGELYSIYPNAATKVMRIDVIGRYELPPAAIAFLQRASASAFQLGLTICHRVHKTE